MATRTRSIIVDNTISKVFTNVVRTADANSSNVIAGSIKNSLVIAAFGGSTSVRLGNNLMGKTNGYPIVSPTLITAFRLTLRRFAVGGTTGVRVVLKMGTTYDTSVVVATISTFTIAATLATGILVDPGQNLYLDITGIGSISPGAGLTISMEYFVA